MPRTADHLQGRIDFARWERYLSYRNLFEFLTRAAIPPIRQPARRESALYERLCALDAIEQEYRVA